MSQLRNPEAIGVLAKNVRKYRIERDLSQEALANLAGIEYSQVSRIERGVINTSVSVIFALAGAMGLNPSELLR